MAVEREERTVMWRETTCRGGRDGEEGLTCGPHFGMSSM